MLIMQMNRPTIGSTIHSVRFVPARRKPLRGGSSHRGGPTRSPRSGPPTRRTAPPIPAARATSCGVPYRRARSPPRIPPRRQGRDRHRCERRAGRTLRRVLDAVGRTVVARGASLRPARPARRRTHRRAPVACDLAEPTARRVRSSPRRSRTTTASTCWSTTPGAAIRHRCSTCRPTSSARRCASTSSRRSSSRANARASMVEGDGGAIVNVASIWGLVGVGQIPEAGYAASKGGLINLTRELGRAVGAQGRARQLPRARAGSAPR